MPVNCPQCGHAMSEVDATQAQCARHGAYQILFKRTVVDEEDELIPLAPSSEPSPAPAASHIPQHSSYARPVAVRGLGPCENHPKVAAVQYCSRCNARICGVCDFSFPGEVHFCPLCITSTSGTLSSGRKGMMIAAYILAGTTTLLIAATMAAFSGGHQDEGDVAVFFILLCLVMICSVIGAGLGIGTIDRQLANPVSVWIAALWNGVMLLGLLLMMLVGFIMRGE